MTRYWPLALTCALAAAWTCRQGIAGFCACPAGLEAETCRHIESQCARSFCSVCLHSAWQSVVEVNCSASPSWKGCSEFQRELYGRGGVESALTAQFQVRTLSKLPVGTDLLLTRHAASQAHVCSSVLGCCDAADPALPLLVEDALFGERYPLAALPAPACAAAVQGGRGEAACDSCRAAVRVELRGDPGACASSSAASAAPGRRAVPSSWEERCAFVADLVQARGVEGGGGWGGGGGTAC